MFPRKNSFQILFTWILLFTTGCAVMIGPKPTPLQSSTQKPILRLGEVTETLTGSWAGYPGVGSVAFQGPLVEALEKPEAKAFFLESASNLTLDIHLTSDHEVDEPRLSNLGLLSIATFGVIPLNYFSEWKVDCDVKISKPDGTLVADYVLHERGTYNTWVGPPTMIWLLFNGIRGNYDWRRIANRVANNLTAKILQAIETDYPKLASKAGIARKPEAESDAGTPKPLIT